MKKKNVRIMSHTDGELHTQFAKQKLTFHLISKKNKYIFVYL